MIACESFAPMPVSASMAQTIGNDTFFATKEFVEAWSRAFPGQYLPLAVPVRESGPPRTMYFLQARDRYWSRRIPLTRFDFFSSPGWQDELSRSTTEEILDSLTGLRTRSVAWNVRFDHELLADHLASLGLSSERISTHIIPISSDYDSVFSSYNATIRNHVRKALRRGLAVRATTNAADVRAFHQVYGRVAKEKGWQQTYPIELTLELIKLSSTARFYVAEFDKRIVGGAMFVRDGESVCYYFYGVQDRDYEHIFPSCAVIDSGIRWACESNIKRFNLGMSGGVASLDKFKSMWGAYPMFNWSFTWTNPIWRRLGAIRQRIREV